MAGVVQVVPSQRLTVFAPAPNDVTFPEGVPIDTPEAPSSVTFARVVVASASPSEFIARTSPGVPGVTEIKCSVPADLAARSRNTA